MGDEGRFLIWAVDHQKWWLARYEGITANRDEAHAYTRAEAAEIAGLLPPGRLVVIPVGEPLPESAVW